MTRGCLGCHQEEPVVGGTRGEPLLFICLLVKMTQGWVIKLHTENAKYRRAKPQKRRPSGTERPDHEPQSHNISLLQNTVLRTKYISTSLSMSYISRQARNRFKPKMGVSVTAVVASSGSKGSDCLPYLCRRASSAEGRFWGSKRSINHVRSRASLEEPCKTISGSCGGISAKCTCRRTTQGHTAQMAWSRNRESRHV